MKRSTEITTLFLDIGGVLLTDGWNLAASRLAAKTFNLEMKDLHKRHTQALGAFEEGKLTLDELLHWMVFYKGRPFTLAQFRNFMFAQSRPFPKMIGLIRRLKARYNVKIVVVSNEGRELNEYRIQKFKLDGFVDYFISSCYVRLRKPDPEIFRVALDTVRVPAEQVVYIENTQMFVEVAEGLGIRSILHTDAKSTRVKFASLGLRADERALYGD